MAILKIARMGHPVLARPADSVPDPTAPEIHDLIRDMVDTMIDAPGQGLAAPQVHVSLRSEEHTSELQSLMRLSYAVFCLKKNKDRLLIQRPNTNTLRPHAMNLALVPSSHAKIINSSRYNRAIKH